jgi:hypothetical protein
MARNYKLFSSLLFLFLALVTFRQVEGQARETYSGTVLYYGTGFNTRTVSRTFTLTINGTTPDGMAQEYLSTLQSGGQDAVLRSIKREELGRFSVGGGVGVPVNVVRESMSGNQKRIFIVFERWTQFAELRGGYRSLDYPFGVIELNINESNGKGDGTYIAAAQIRWKQDKKSGQYQVEIENFATFPAKLLGVTRRK